VQKLKQTDFLEGFYSIPKEASCQKCVKCGVEKPWSAFQRHSKYNSGYDTRCKECFNKMLKIVKVLKENAPPMPEVCDCCGKPFKKTPCLDHCHETLEFRGWLCDRCNMALGCLGDTVESLERALKYLKNEL
tara:strand:+ start:121 stop:516 length:396 start_codon:yes stop_codon:yes gene_type:complete